jgi:amino acid transporter
LLIYIGLLTWVSILVSHIAFCRQRKVQRIDTTYIPFRAPLGAYGSYAALVFLVILILTKGAEVFVGKFDYGTFIVQYIGIPVYLLCIFGYKMIKKSRRVRNGEADLITDVPEETVAEERARFEQARRQKELSKGAASYLAKAYRKTLSWLF